MRAQGRLAFLRRELCLQRAETRLGFHFCLGALRLAICV